MNGVTACSSCHKLFDEGDMWVESVDGKLIIKVHVADTKYKDEPDESDSKSNKVDKSILKKLANEPLHLPLLDRDDWSFPTLSHWKWHQQLSEKLRAEKATEVAKPGPYACTKF